VKIEARHETTTHTHTAGDSYTLGSVDWRSVYGLYDPVVAGSRSTVMGETVVGKCSFCNADMVRRSDDSRGGWLREYCSSACRMAAWRVRKNYSTAAEVLESREHAGVERPCEVCGKMMPAGVLRGRLRRFCSDPCRDKNRNKTGYDSRWESTIRRKYSITAKDYGRMLQAQDGVCKICKQPPSPDKRLAVDHDHLTGKVRGLLCSHCNGMVGWFEMHLEEAFAYILLSESNME
jgi:hypothetical protein